ncbi:MAG: 5-(carboxyamino)imidazole ribonucleotide synthase [Granulosicoccus sp.]|nr:5-(carboxyamino)imidazole ribonucleotide synthase [Granulosicoccus sp.]
MTVRKLNPGATLGVIGGGQLGRYFALIARQRGYEVWVLDPDESAPAMQLASVALVAGYDDESALRKLASACDGITIEFENVPAASLRLLESLTQLAPLANSVELAQDRILEKQQASACGLMPVPYAVIESEQDLESALKTISLPAILKTARLGYDGKGQRNCNSADELIQAFEDLGSVSCVLEQRINLASELSVVLARGFDGQFAVFPVASNVHIDGILFSSAVPALNVPKKISQAAIEQSKALAASIEHIGVLAVEFFVDVNSSLYFNEMAPRPHNSGHYTLDATVCSQFEQQMRVLCGQPLGSTELLSAVAMFNLLGHLWPDGASPDFSRLLSESGCQLHLYGKAQARLGRKMGHVNCLAESVEKALQTATEQYQQMMHRK